MGDTPGLIFGRSWPDFDCLQISVKTFMEPWSIAGPFLWGKAYMMVKTTLHN